MCESAGRQRLHIGVVSGLVLTFGFVRDNKDDNENKYE